MEGFEKTKTIKEISYSETVPDKKQNVMGAYDLKSERVGVQRAHYTLDDFLDEWNESKIWHGKNTTWINGVEGKEKGARSFYNALLKFAKKESNGNPAIRKEIIEMFFEPERIYRDGYTVDDYEAEWAQHSEWHKMNPKDLWTEQGKENGAASFYESLRKFVSKESKGDEKKRLSMMEKFFTLKIKHRDHYSLNDFKKEWEENLGWHELSAHKETRENGLAAFYQAFLLFARKNSDGDLAKQREIMEEIFQPKHVRRDRYSLDDFKKEWGENPEWHGLSVSQAVDGVGIGLGLDSFYHALQRYLKKEYGEDIKKQKEIFNDFFEQKYSYRSDYSLDDFKKEWGENPEWHGMYASHTNKKEGRENGASSFYSALLKFAQNKSDGDPHVKREIMKDFFLLGDERIQSRRGWILQYATEVVLKIVNNKNLLVESSLINSETQKVYRPDLMYEYPNKRKVIIIDVKLQTTTYGIQKDKVNYSKLIEEKYPDGGNLIFLCLNGPDMQSELSGVSDKVKVRYYHVLDFIERLTDQQRNKSLLRLLTSDESSEGVPVILSKEQIQRIEEIYSSLLMLKRQVSGEVSYQEGQSPEEIDIGLAKIERLLKKLAKGKGEVSDEILGTDFTQVMNFIQ